MLTMNRNGQLAPLVVPVVAGVTDPREQRYIRQAEDADEIASRRASPLISIAPTFKTITGHFTQIAVPAGVQIDAGKSAAYVLKRYSVVGTDTLLFGGFVELASSDSGASGITGIINAGPGAGTALGWGDRTGSTAAIIVAKSTGLALNAWGSMLAGVPGIENGSAGNGANITKLSQDSQPEHLRVETFPGGAWNDTTPTVKTRDWQTFPAVNRLTQGDDVDIVLVMSRAYVHNLGAARVVCGRGLLSLRVIETGTLNTLSGRR